MIVQLWWHEPSNYFDILLPNGFIWRHEGGFYSKWRKFKPFCTLKHEDAEGWICIGEFK